MNTENDSRLDERLHPDLPISDIGSSLQIAGVLYAGADGHRAFLLMLPEEPAIAAGAPVLHLDADLWTRVVRQSDLMEFMADTVDDQGRKRKVILRKAERQVSQHISWEVFRRDGYACCYCGTDSVPLTVDHLVPWEDGGPTIPANLLTACKKCNQARGNMPYEEWLGSSYYLRVSRGLTDGRLRRNRELVHSLEQIPVTPLKPGKRKSR